MRVGVEGCVSEPCFPPTAPSSRWPFILLLQAALGIYLNQQIPGFRLNLTSCQLAAIFAGQIKMWSDPGLKGLDPSINAWPLPNPVLNFPINVKTYVAGNRGGHCCLSD